MPTERSSALPAPEPASIMSSFEDPLDSSVLMSSGFSFGFSVGFPFGFSVGFPLGFSVGFASGSIDPSSPSSSTSTSSQTSTIGASVVGSGVVSSHDCVLHFSSAEGIESTPHSLISAVALLARHNSDRVRLPDPHVFEHYLKIEKKKVIWSEAPEQMEITPILYEKQKQQYSKEVKYLAPRSSEPDSLALIGRHVAFGRVLVSLGWIALVVIHFGDNVVLIRLAAKHPPGLNSSSAVGRALHKTTIMITRIRLLIIITKVEDVPSSTERRTRRTRKPRLRRTDGTIPGGGKRDKTRRRKPVL